MPSGPGANRPEIKAGIGRTGGVSFGGPHAIGYIFRGPIDVGQGANPWAYSTLALPLYTAIGTGIPNKRHLDTIQSSGVMWSRPGMDVTTLGNPGNISGSFYSQPLLNTDAPSSPFPIGAFRAGEFLIPTG